jgi:hypothetical protein
MADDGRHLVPFCNYRVPEKDRQRADQYRRRRLQDLIIPMVDRKEERKMSQVGSIPPNLHEGSRSEYLAQYVLASFGTSVAVPHQEDHGVDFFCNVIEKKGRRAFARAAFTAQVKSDFKPWFFKSKESVEWLINHPLPLFFCVLTKTTSTLRIYHTFPRFYTWGLGDLPDQLEMKPTKTYAGQSTQASLDYKFLLVPILEIEISRLSDKTY